MFSKKPSSKLEIGVPAGIHFLHPPPPGQLPTEELVLNGYVNLILTKPKKVDEILVRLENRVKFNAPGSGFTLDEVLLDRQLSVKVNDVLPPGEHRYSYAFPVPASSAPYERTQYGNIKMNVIAEVSGDTIHLKEKQMICVFASPMPQGMLAPDLDFNHSAFDDALGIYRVEFLSPSATPGSLLRAHIVFQGTPAPVQILQIKFTCVQMITLRSIADPTKTHSPSPMSFTFRTLDTTMPLTRVTVDPPNAIIEENLGKTTNKWKPFMRVEPHQRTSLTVLPRLPKDDVLRPSTQTGTDTPLLLTHQLEIALTFSTPDTPSRTLHLSTPLELCSCTLMPVNVQVPEYEREDPHPASSFIPSNLPTQNLNAWLENRDHVCTIPTDKLVEQSKTWNLPHSEQAILDLDNDGRGRSGVRTPKEDFRQSSLESTHSF